MRKLFLFYSIGMLITLSAFSQQEPEGWEFLKWKINRAEAEKEAGKISEIKRGSMLDANFDYNGMSTWLEFNNNDELIKARQRKTFSVIQSKEAEEFFRSRMEYMISKYGKPSEKDHNRKDDVIIVKWEFPNTVITLEYDYKYKVIDEFGAGSYWVEIVYEYR